MSTKEQYLKILRRELSKHDWAKEHGRLDKAMEYATETLNGKKTCRIDSESWITAWREIGMKAKPTYKGLHSLPEGEAS